jgi:predicted nucleotidyltransferase
MSVETKVIRQARLRLPHQQITAFCQRHHIRKLSLFGSALRDDFGSESDIDILVEFEPGQTVGFLKLAALEIELSEMVGRKVDLRTPAELSRYFRQEVMAEAEVQYEQR